MLKYLTFQPLPEACSEISCKKGVETLALPRHDAIVICFNDAAFGGHPDCFIPSWRCKRDGLASSWHRVKIGLPFLRMRMTKGLSLQTSYLHSVLSFLIPHKSCNFYDDVQAIIFYNHKLITVIVNSSFSLFQIENLLNFWCFDFADKLLHI